MNVHRMHDMLDIVSNRYEMYSYQHALEILTQSFPEEFFEVLDSLNKFSITIDDILREGGNKSVIPKNFDNLLFPLGWKEIRISGDLVVRKYERNVKTPIEEIILSGYIDGHNIDYVKGRVALDLEWNSKDQTYDRDLLAMKTYFDSGVIDVGIIVTRAENLNDIFRDYGILAKYGSSTTWMGKLLPRLDSRRQGGCPILAIGIRKQCVLEYRHGT